MIERPQFLEIARRRGRSRPGAADDIPDVVKSALEAEKPAERALELMARAHCRLCERSRENLLSRRVAPRVDQVSRAQQARTPEMSARRRHLGPRGQGGR